MNETNHDRWREDVAAYLLGALEPEAAAELERHAEDCERCREEVRWLLPAVNALPESVAPLPLPRELRSKVLAEARADARQADSERAAAEGGLWHRAGAWLRGLGSGPMGLRPVAGIAVAVLVVAAVAGFAIGGGIGGGSEDGGATSTVVSGHAPDITAEVVSSSDGGTLRLANVDQIPDDRVLQAWVQRDGEVEAVPALFVPDNRGRASTTIDDMGGVEVVMVTTEPKGGSRAPTSAPIATVPLQ